MADTMTAVQRMRFSALADLPAIPQHYHIAVRDTPFGVRVDVLYQGHRIFEMAIEMHYVPEYDDPYGTRYAAREVYDDDPDKLTFNQPEPWQEYPDLPTLVTSMITKHRLGVI